MDGHSTACAEYGGKMAVVRGDADEPAASVNDRAWFVAKTLAFDPFADPERVETTSKAWACWLRRGCVYDDAVMRDVGDAHRRL